MSYAQRPRRTTTGKAAENDLLAPSSMLPANIRWGIYTLLIAIAVGNMMGRLLAVNSVDRVQLEAHRIQQHLTREREKLAEEGLNEDQVNDQMATFEARVRNELKLQRPFLSANDRSRWMTIRSLVEHGTYEIDKILEEPTWDTIDMVQHRGWDGELHLYSSKPPLLATLIAGEYWLINRLTGATLRDRPYEIGRAILITVNILPLVLMFVLVGKLVERFGASDWGRVFVMAAATMGTMLNAFAVVLNNHVPGAVSAAVTIYLLVRISADGERRWWYFFLAGLAAAFTVADELPALAFFGLVGLILLWRAPWRTLLGFAPGAAIVAAAFFATNWIAHQSFRPPYMHRNDSNPEDTNPEDNWYHYTYTVNGKERQSYWMDRKGIDRGEPTKSKYALHSLVGHHGVFSLTPVWLLSIVGIGMWLIWPDWSRRELAALTAAVSIICLLFFIVFREQIDRNYGGMTSGFRWMFWCAPLWLAVMIPAADRIATSRLGKAFAIVLLTFSVLSASYPTWNPWTHPWIYNWLVWSGWQGF